LLSEILHLRDSSRILKSVTEGKFDRVQSNCCFFKKLHHLTFLWLQLGQELHVLFNLSFLKLLTQCLAIIPAHPVSFHVGAHI